jgi:hypothetical protein
MVKKLYEWKLKSTRSAGRPKIRLEINTKENLRVIKVNNWTKHIQERVKWKEIAEKAKSFRQ